MAVMADDLAFFRDHGMAALGAGIKKGLHLVVLFLLLVFFSKIQERGKAFNAGFRVWRIIVHGCRLT